MKTIEIIDNGIAKKFIIKQLKCMIASKLLIQLGQIVVNDKFIDGLLIKQQIHNIAGTGVEVKGVSQAEIDEYAKTANDQQMKNLINSILSGLNDINHDEIVQKFLSGVVYLNGALEVAGWDAYEQDMIHDVPTLYQLIYEVAIDTFTGAFERLGKLINLH